MNGSFLGSRGGARMSATRRSFLRAVGAGLASSLPFYRMLEHAYAESAGGETPPLKFLGVYQPHGICAEYFALRDGETSTHFDLTYEHCSLRAFDDAKTFGKSFKDQIVVIEGLDLLSNGNAHDSAGTILTGSTISEGRPASLSLDQFLAVEHGLGDATPVTSVALAVGDPELTSGYGLSFGPGGHPLSKIIDPSETFDALFRGLVVGDNPAAQREAERQRRRGKSVLDFVRGDVNRLRTRLAAEEQKKLDQHLYSLRELEKQVAGTPGKALHCGKLKAPPTFAKVGRRDGGAVHFDAITDLQIDLLAQAVACDITRFGTLFMADLPYHGNPLGLPADNHGAVAHVYAGKGLGGGRGAAGKPATWLPLAKLNAYHFGKVARLMSRLDQLGALASTLIYVSSDMGDPAQHSTRNVPTVLAGGCNGKFKLGRRLRMPSDCPAAHPLCSSGGPDDARVPNNKLLVSIAQAFGVHTNTFGAQADPRHAEGALPGL
jgi:hypothetical protein